MSDLNILETSFLSSFEVELMPSNSMGKAKLFFNLEDLIRNFKSSRKLYARTCISGTTGGILRITSRRYIWEANWYTSNKVKCDSSSSGLFRY